jgi:predicted nucleic acid-binding protein
LAAVEIEKTKLPQVCVLDAGFMLLAMSQRSYRPDSPICRAVFEALLDDERLNAGARVLIPAPALAELLRGASKQEPPRVRGVFIAPFTARTARHLCQYLSESVIETIVGETKLPRAYVKYDSMIAATAITYDATLIALDGWFHRESKRKQWPIRVATPSEYVRAQTELDFPDPHR